MIMSYASKVLYRLMLISFGVSHHSKLCNIPLLMLIKPLVLIVISLLYDLIIVPPLGSLLATNSLTMGLATNIDVVRTTNELNR